MAYSVLPPMLADESFVDFCDLEGHVLFMAFSRCKLEIAFPFVRDATVVGCQVVGTPA